MGWIERYLGVRIDKHVQFCRAEKVDEGILFTFALLALLGNASAQPASCFPLSLDENNQIMEMGMINLDYS